MFNGTNLTLSSDVDQTTYGHLRLSHRADTSQQKNFSQRLKLIHANFIYLQIKLKFLLKENDQPCLSLATTDTQEF